MKAVKVISHHRLVCAIFALLSILVLSQPVLADFYVVPVGGPRVKPSDVVELKYGPIPENTPANPTRITKSGQSIANFTVPTGKVLVITLIRIESPTYSTGTLEMTFFGTPATTWRIWLKVPEYLTNDFPYPSGLVLGPEVPLTVAYWIGNPPQVTVRIYGYLTDDN